VKEDTPVFAVLEQAIVPLVKSGTSKSITLIIWTLIGGVMGLAFGEVYVKNIEYKWNDL